MKTYTILLLGLALLAWQPVNVEAQINTYALILEDEGSGVGTGGTDNSISLLTPADADLTQSYSLLLPSNTNLGVGSLLFVDSMSGTTGMTSWLPIGSNGEVLTIESGEPVWKAGGGSADWSLVGNVATSATTNFLGTTDGQPLVVRTDNVERARILSTGPVQLTSSTGSTGELRFMEPTTGGINHTGMRAQAQGSDITYILPDTAGIPGDVLAVKSVSVSDITLDWRASLGSLLFARKGSDESDNSSTLQADDDLTIAVETNRTYRVSGTLFVEGQKNKKFDLAFDVPTGATVLIGISGHQTPNDDQLRGGSGIRDVDAQGATSAGTPTGWSGDYKSLKFRDTDYQKILFDGLVITGATAGNITVMWTNDGGGYTATVVENSFMTVQVVE